METRKEGGREKEKKRQRGGKTGREGGWKGERKEKEREEGWRVERESERREEK